MNSINKPLLTSISLILLIAGLFWFTQRAPNEPSMPQLTQTNADKITRIPIKRKHNDILLEKMTAGDGWQLIQPISAKANPNRIQFVLDLLKTPVFKQQTDALDLTPFGLAPSQVQLHLNEHLFEFGNIAPLNEQRYLHYDQQLYLIADRIYPLLLANPSSFIDHQLITKQQRLITVSWSGLDKQPDGQLSQAEGHWTSSDNTLNADQIGSLLTAWQHSQASSLHILDNPPDTTAAKLTLQLEEHANPIHYQIQFTQQEILLQQHGHRLQYHFPLTIQSQLFPPAELNEPDA